MTAQLLILWVDGIHPPCVTEFKYLLEHASAEFRSIFGGADERDRPRVEESRQIRHCAQACISQPLWSDSGRSVLLRCFGSAASCEFSKHCAGNESGAARIV